MPLLPKQPFVLVAESSSGPLAIRLAAEHPGIASHLILVLSFVRGPLPSALRGLLGIFRHMLPPTSLTRLVMLGWHPSAEAAAEFDRMYRPLNPALMHKRMRAALDVDATAELASTKFPLLVISGGSDRLCGTRLHESIRDCRGDAEFVVLEGPHCLLEPQPREVADCVVTWLEKN